MKLILLLLCAASVFSQTPPEYHQDTTGIPPSQNWQNPSYWGLKGGEYIPGPGCFAGNWPGSRHKLDFEICAKITYL